MMKTALFIAIFGTLYTAVLSNYVQQLEPEKTYDPPRNGEYPPEETYDSLENPDDRPEKPDHLPQCDYSEEAHDYSEKTYDDFPQKSYVPPNQKDCGINEEHTNCVPCDHVCNEAEELCGEYCNDRYDYCRCKPGYYRRSYDVYVCIPREWCHRFIKP